MTPLPKDLTERERAIVQHFNDRLLQIEHRIAFQNKVAATAYLQSHEHAVFEELINK